MADILSVLKSHVGIRYISLTLLLVFLLHQITVYTPYGPSSFLPDHAWEQGSPPPVAQNEIIPAAPVVPDVIFHTVTQIIERPIAIPTLLTKPQTLEPADHGSSSAAHDIDTPVYDVDHQLYSRIGKVSSIYYDSVNEKSQAYEKALLSHKEHNVRYGYKHFVQRRGAIDKLWSKHAYLIHILVQELNKPPSERLEWLFWHDADVVLLNSKFPLESFLPPDEARWAHINLLISNDMGGLNDGTFFLRVCEWSVYFFAAGLSFPHYRPTTPLRYDEQTALGFLLEDEKYRNNSLHVPQRWFNAYHHWGHDDTIPPEWKHEYHENAPGDLLVHLPGSGDIRSRIINEYLGYVTTQYDKWNVPFNETRYFKEVPEWWDKDAPKEKERQDSYWRRYHILKSVGANADREKATLINEMKVVLKTNSTDAQINDAVKQFEQEWKLVKMERLRAEEKAMISGEKPDNTKAD